MDGTEFERGTLNSLLSGIYQKPWRTVGFPGGSGGKESACDEGDLGSIPGSGRSLEEGNGYPLQHSGLENSMDCINKILASKSNNTLKNHTP